MLLRGRGPHSQLRPGKRIAENLARGAGVLGRVGDVGDLPMLVAAAYRLHRLDAAGAPYEVGP